MSKEISKNFDPAKVENKCYQFWSEQGYFHSKPDDREPYTIVIPPPNVTGVLHMGHILNNTIQDVLIRRARMKGYNACWVPGSDHASIATEAKVVAKLRKKGISKFEIGREKFLEHAWEWTKEHQGRIFGQLKKLGVSCDWSRERFTMEDDLSDAVNEVFVALYEKGHLYRGLKMINWDPKAKTTLSNEEVIYREEIARLYYVKYAIQDSDETITIATTRPETILGDTAVCVHPEDERYSHLVGKKVIIPIVNRAVPVIADTYVDREFGTGALKITPAHDTNDYEIGQRHQLEVIDIFNDDGTLSKAAQHFVGVDRMEARKLVYHELKKSLQIVQVEELHHKVGYSERNPDTVVEPKLSLQWFVNMQEIVRPALENVLNGEIRFHPKKYENIYKHWLENIRDWPISRQLWWGQQIPAYYFKHEGEEKLVVATSPEEALEKAKAMTGNAAFKAADLKRDEDVVDTWFSSWLWPISVFDGFKDPNNPEFKYYYPTNVLVTGWDIIFFWVARMIIAGYEFKNLRPFQDVYFTGMVRDMNRKKMSKSLGNSPEPLDLIENFGADGVRFGILYSAPAGNDLLFDEKYCEQGRNFSNKLWNAFRLIKGWKVDPDLAHANATGVRWFENRLNQAIEEIDRAMDQFRLSEALMTIYKLIWDDFCSWYLEIVKPAYGAGIDQKTMKATITFMDKILRLAHPFVPFITEEIWQQLSERKADESIMVSDSPQASDYDNALLEKMQDVQQIITGIREIRANDQIPNNTSIDCFVESATNPFEEFADVICKCANLKVFESRLNQESPSRSFVVAKFKFHVISEIEIDMEEEREKITKELDYVKGFLASINKKLSNERFVNNAPAQVVDKEKQKQSDAQNRMKLLEESLERLN